jgi:hypothetical protein
MKTKRSTYKARRTVNGADRYASFSGGQQQSSETVAGTTVTHKFSKS